ncbi:MAG: protein tyrosine phosphatase family protein [Proteobacteria bacterium]|nr:protein tyrosine phosphatase family protein [Pseudomonadota bacterium]
MIKDSGIEIVINLARADSPNAIINEAQIVQENEMHYIHIPVDFKKPDIADLELFFKAMDEHNDKNTLVHCAYNWRVSSFVYLYRIIKQGKDDETAKQDMLAIWQPDETWQTFIDECVSKAEQLK